jgi:enamine deaminase RidA (YjgF/YER057c/UK114 family)
MVFHRGHDSGAPRDRAPGRNAARAPRPEPSKNGERIVANLPVNPPSLPVPRGYAHGTLSGNTLYLAGQTALDGDGRVVAGGIVEQFRQALHTLLAVVRGVGGEPADLVSLTIYLTDVADYQAHGPEIGRAWRELVGSGYPAMAAIGCTRLWQPEAKIEILGIAVIPDERLRPPSG